MTQAKSKNVLMLEDVLLEMDFIFGTRQKTLHFLLTYATHFLLGISAVKNLKADDVIKLWCAEAKSRREKAEQEHRASEYKKTKGAINLMPSVIC